MSCRKTLTGASRILVRGALFLLLCITALTSCSPKQEYSILTFEYPRPNERHELNEDATKDSIIFLTSDNFTVTTDVDWIEVISNRSSKDIVNDGHSQYRVKSDLSIKSPNTTGEERVGLVTVTTDFGTISAAFYQPVKEANKDEE